MKDSAEIQAGVEKYFDKNVRNVSQAIVSKQLKLENSVTFAPRVNATSRSVGPRSINSPAGLDNIDRRR